MSTHPLPWHHLQGFACVLYPVPRSTTCVVHLAPLHSGQRGRERSGRVGLSLSCRGSCEGRLLPWRLSWRLSDMPHFTTCAAGARVALGLAHEVTARVTERGAVRERGFLMIPLPPKVKLVVGVLIAGLLAAGGYWDKALVDAGFAVPAWLPPVLAMLTFLEGFVTVPAGATKALSDATKKITDLTAKMGGMSAVLFLAGFLSVQGAQGCKGAQFPSLSKVEEVVLTDLAECGDSPACVTKMETDVATLIAQGVLGPDAGADAVTLVKDALQTLIDIGVLPPSILPKAQHALGAEKIKLAAPCTVGE